MLYIITILYQFIDKHPGVVGTVISSINVLSVSLAWLDVINGLLQAATLFGSIVVSGFTVRYLIKKTKTIKNKEHDD